ncbi:ABC transporter ATP-binding protein [Microvirga puerhi]|uniref:ABC transporter ATP-binding protein n=1 Tax=Microvirga puerhi TaxID=2876078 RepID=A0ABS7VU24_9HYPH|nr:ABC transporter ATP-binding protein [Microvirga puerhi]MBZ6079083.1 ABC transporter ATP-binding protein [Microvirga puerhi]
MLEVAGLNAFYGDSHILHGVDLTVDTSDRVSVLGRNGSGKTTLMKSILNAGPRIYGRICLDGADLADEPSFQRARSGLSLVPEDRRSFPHLTVRDNLLIALTAAGKRTGLDIEQVLDTFPMLKPLTARYGSQLSGGQQQMVAVARGVMPRPRCLLLDEPTEGLAPVIVRQLAASLVRLCDEFNIGLLLSEQNIWFARFCTQRVYIIENGRIVFSGSWDEFDSRPDVKHLYLAV